jgi:hypothetical protein
MEKQLFYFGCRTGFKGHYLHDSDGREMYPQSVKIEGFNSSILKVLDGTFTPKDWKESVYKESNVPPAKIVAWWDYSEDTRPGSNMVLIGFGYTTAEEMIDAAYIKFPKTMGRMKRPVSETIK